MVLVGLASFLRLCVGEDLLIVKGFIGNRLRWVLMGVIVGLSGSSEPDVVGMKERGDVEGLIGALMSKRVWVRKKAAEALGEIGDRRAVDALIEGLRARPPVGIDRSEVLEILGSSGVVRGAELIPQVLKINYGLLRVAAAEALGRIRDARAVQPLIQALGDENDVVSMSAAQALLRMRESAFESLVEALRDGSVLVRIGVVGVLGRTGDRRAVEPLIEALNDESEFVRRVVPASLGMIGDVRAVEPLTRALEDRDKDVRKAAKEALKDIKGKKT